MCFALSRICALAYADDLCLLCTSLQQADAMLKDVREAFARAGLEISPDIDKNLIMQVVPGKTTSDDALGSKIARGNVSHHQKSITLGGVHLEVVQTMTVLQEMDTLEIR